MPDPTQANRRIAINTPLGPDVLVVRRCSIREELSRLFELEVDVVSKKNDINFDELIGKNVTVRLEVGRQQSRYFNGYVSRFVQTKSERSYSAYRATVVPWLWFLSRSADCRIFQESMEEPPEAMTVPGIIKKVFKDHGFEDFRDDGLSGTYREWDYCVQYRETAFNFVSRLMELEGISYFFEHSNGKHVLVLSDSANGHVTFPGYETVPYHPHTQGSTDREAVTDWVVNKEVRPGNYVLNDFNFENPRQAQQKGLVVNSETARAHDLSTLALYDYPGTHVTAEEGEVLARLRIEEMQSRHELLHGQASARGLGAGYKFKLQSHPRADQNREYLITGVHYHVDAGEFETASAGAATNFLTCSFSAIPAAQPFRPGRITPKPQIHGPQTAMVVGPSGDETHTDKYGRVKVQFHWDRYGKQDENASCWMRVSQAWAGKGWGAFALPRVGNEVIVEFLEGDPDRPIVTGQVYNADAMPPYALPTHATMTTIKTNSSKGGGGFNELRFEDKKGEEQVFLHAEKNKDVRVKSDSMEWVGNNRHLTVKNDKLEHVENNRNEKVANDHKEEIGGARHLKITGLETKEVGGTLSLKVTGDVTESFEAKHAEEATGDLYLKSGAMVVIEGTQGITLKCGGNNVVIDSTGVTIKGSQVVVDGSMVKIASGPGSSPASGAAGAIEALTAPELALEAALADPGQAMELAAQNLQMRGVAPGSVEVPELPDNAVDEQTSWISIELKDDTGAPVPNERYRVRLADGTFREGALDGEGKARVAGIKPGTCEVSFPAIDGDEWKPA